MYARAGSAFRNSLGLFGGFALMLMMVDVLLPPPLDWPTSLLLTGGLAFFCHRMILLDEAHTWTGMFNQTKEPKTGAGPFLMRFFGLALISGGALSLFDHYTGYFTPQEFQITVLLILLIYVLVLAGIGTILPAAAIGGDAGLSAAIVRIKPIYIRTVVRLLIGPLLFGIVVAILGISAERAILQMGLSGDLHAIGLTLGIRSLQFCMALATCFVTLLAATALSLAFEETDRAAG